MPHRSTATPRPGPPPLPAGAPRSRPRGVAAWRRACRPGAWQPRRTFCTVLAFAAPLLRPLGRASAAVSSSWRLPRRQDHARLIAASVSAWTRPTTRPRPGQDRNRFDEAAEQRNHLRWCWTRRCWPTSTTGRAPAWSSTSPTRGLRPPEGRLGEDGRGRRWLPSAEHERAHLARDRPARRGNAMTGQLRRLTDIVLPCAPGLGIFGTWTGRRVSTTSADRLRRGAAANRGVAGEAYLGRLVAHVRRDRMGWCAGSRPGSPYYLGRAGAAAWWPTRSRSASRWSTRPAGSPRTTGSAVLRAEILPPSATATARRSEGEAPAGRRESGERRPAGARRRGTIAQRRPGSSTSARARYQRRR